MALMAVRVRRFVAILVLAAAIVGSAVMWRDTALGVADFTSFWIAGHQLLEHQNPYDSGHALTVERSLGFDNPRPLVMRNPPWTLWATLPLGMLAYSNARLLWTVCLVVMLWWSVKELWKIYDGSTGQYWAAIILTFSFAPTLACLAVGQTAPFVLLGLTLFLCLYSRHEFWAGFFLLFVAFKPQIVFLLWPVLLLWSLQYRRWKLVLGTLFGIVLGTAVALVFDTQVLAHYRVMLAGESIQTQFLPTFGGFLRAQFGRAYLQVVPAAAGVLGILLYYYLRRKNWDWKQYLPALCFASLLLTPYAWLGDEVIVLTGLIAAAAAIAESSYSHRIAALFVAVNIVIISMLVKHVRVNSSSYIWSIWAWTILYIATKAYAVKRQQLQAALCD